MKYFLILLLSVACFTQPTLKELKGVDGNKNGISDEVDEYIEKITKDQYMKSALEQYAKYLRLGYNTYIDKGKSILNSYKVHVSKVCVYGIWKKQDFSWKNKYKFDDILRVLNQKTFNSKKALEIKEKITENFSKESTKSVKVFSKVCEFDITNLFIIKRRIHENTHGF